MFCGFPNRIVEEYRFASYSGTISVRNPHFGITSKIKVVTISRGIDVGFRDNITRFSLVEIGYLKNLR